MISPFLQFFGPSTHPGQCRNGGPGPALAGIRSCVADPQPLEHTLVAGQGEDVAGSRTRRRSRHAAARSASRRSGRRRWASSSASTAAMIFEAAGSRLLDDWWGELLGEALVISASPASGVDGGGDDVGGIAERVDGLGPGHGLQDQEGGHRSAVGLLDAPGRRNPPAGPAWRAIGVHEEAVQRGSRVLLLGIGHREGGALVARGSLSFSRLLKSGIWPRRARSHSFRARPSVSGSTSQVVPERGWPKTQAPRSSGNPPGGRAGRARASLLDVSGLGGRWARRAGLRPRCRPIRGGRSARLGRGPYLGTMRFFTVGWRP